MVAARASASRGDELRLRLRVGVSGEQDGELPVGDPHGKTVRVLLSGELGRMDQSTTRDPSLVWGHRPGLLVGRLGRFEGRRGRLEGPGGVGGARHPDLLHAEAAENLVELADVVGMAMGDGHHVEVRDAERLQLGHTSSES
jgi:hypothetical protein